MLCSMLPFQNVLEMQVYDEDSFMRDDLCSVILFDISNLTLGQKQTKMFIINEKVKPKLLWLCSLADAKIQIQ